MHACMCAESKGESSEFMHDRRAIWEREREEERERERERRRGGGEEREKEREREFYTLPSLFNFFNYLIIFSFLIDFYFSKFPKI